MKKTTLILLAFIACLQTMAQQPKVIYSPGFDEPEGGWNKLMQLKNGNTFFFHFTKKEGIDLIVYDADHKKKQQRTLTSKLWEPRKMQESTIEGLYEIAGHPVIFLQQLIERTPTLFRIILDANTGAVVDEKQIGELPRYTMGAAFAMAFGGVDAEDFYVEKDPASDDYAVVNFNSFAHESDKRVEVVLYGGEKHDVLNHAFYDSHGFKYLRYIGMCVANKDVFVCTYGFNTEASGGKDTRVILSKLGQNDKDFTYKLLDFTDDFKDTKSIMQMNPGSGMIQLMTLTLTKGKNRWFTGGKTNYYMTLMNYIDPQSLTIVSTKPMVCEKASAYAQSHLDEEKGYTGLPQNMVINRDNSTSILSEELTLQETYNARGQVTSVKTFLGDIGITELDTKGDETDGCALKKTQMASGRIDPLYISKKSKGSWSYRGAGAPMGGFGMMGGGNNNAFYSYDYVNTDKGKYFLFNEYPKNLERDEDRRRKTVVAISDASTVCYKLDNGKLTCNYLFGNPKDEDISKFCYIESSDFNKDNNTYATLMMKRDGRKKEAHVAWVKFD